MSYMISEVVPDENVVEPYDWSTRYDIEYPLYGLGAAPVVKDECKGKFGKAKKDCEAMKAATVDLTKPEGRGFFSRHKWKIIGGAAGLLALGGVIWYFKRRRGA